MVFENKVLPVNNYTHGQHRSIYLNNMKNI